MITNPQQVAFLLRFFAVIVGVLLMAAGIIRVHARARDPVGHAFIASGILLFFTSFL